MRHYAKILFVGAWLVTGFAQRSLPALADTEIINQAVGNFNAVGAPANTPPTVVDSNITEISTSSSTAPAISGRIFEDINYGGGAGRDFDTANAAAQASGFASDAIAIGNATVELYELQSGNYIKIATTTTAADGTYSFLAGVTDGQTYRVRAVNSTVNSQRVGGQTGGLGVQTFRNDPDASTPAITNEVGGTNPADQDADAQADGTDLASILAQSVTEVVVNGATDNVDFGFNFDTIVNVNDSGQGSFRQFITNSNTLENTNLSQDTLLAGTEHSIFMIPAGQLTSGVAVIALTSPLPAVVDDATAIDGTTQTQNIGDTNSGTLGTGGTVGTGADAIANTGDEPSLGLIEKPEIEIVGNNTIQIGLDLVGDNETVRGIALYGYGLSDPVGNGPLQGDIISRGTGGLIEGNLLGSAAATFADPGDGIRTGGSHIYLDQDSETIVQNNLIVYALRRGIFSTEARFVNFAILNNEVRDNNREDDFTGGGIEFTSFADTFGGPSDGFISPMGTIAGNLIANNSPSRIPGRDNGIEFGGTTDAVITVRDNTISGNSTGISGFSLKLPKPHSNEITIIQNVINDNASAGIEVSSQRGFVFSQNSIYDNGGFGITLVTNQPNDGAYSTDPGTEIFASTPGNDGIDYPVVTAASLDSGTLLVEGFVGAAAAGTPDFANATLEFFIADNDPADQNSGVVVGDGLSVPHGEGRTYLGSCASDANSLFNCSFANAGALGLTDATNITATTTLTRPDGKVVSSEFGAVLLTPTATNPEVLLAKRITAINPGLANEQRFESSYINVGAADDEDNAINWPGPPIAATIGNGTVESYIAGIAGVDSASAIADTTIRPGDQIEYSIFFLSNGDAIAKNMLICDRIPPNTTFVSDAFNSSLAASPGAGGRGLLLGFNGNEVALTNANDGDEVAETGGNDSGIGGYYFSAGTEPSTLFPNINCGGSNDNGAIVIDLSDIPNATGEGAPANSYGFIRFRVAID